MATVVEIMQFFDQKAPFAMQMDFDNAGFLAGRSDAKVSRILVALDVTEEVIQEAMTMCAELIVSHHPLIFHPLKAMTSETDIGRKLMALAKADIAVISTHTNLDAVLGGVNDALAEKIGLDHVNYLTTDGMDAKGAFFGMGRTGLLPEAMSVTAFGEMVKKKLYAGGVRFVDSGKPVHHVAVCGGSGGNLLQKAYEAGCDTLLTADVKYDVFLDAKAMGMNLLDAGHYPTEQVVCPVLANWLEEEFPDIEVFQSDVHEEVFQYL